jgi:hypothetical protein
MRDLWIHDNDLIVGTHGRSFWILDDISPLRETSAELSNSAHLFTPAPAYRVQRDNNTDTPLPPDEPAAANPPDGAILDYYLPAAANSVTLEILDAQGKLVWRFSSTDQHGPTQEELQKQLIPLYWVRKPRQLSTAAGMHRWVWDLHYPAPTAMRHDYPSAAIPHDTPRYPLGPTVLPADYTVRLTVDGKPFTAPLKVKIDPRIKTVPAALEKKFAVETRLASLLSESSLALQQGSSIREQLEKVASQAAAPAKAAIQSFEEKLSTLMGAPGGFFAPPSAEVTLSRLNGNASTLYRQVWQVDAAPTSSQMEGLATTEHDSPDLLKRWNELKALDLPALNRLLRESKVTEIKLETDPHPPEPQEDEE